MAVCIDANCKNYFRGEVIPVSVEVTSNSGSGFSVISDNRLRTYCEVRTSSGEPVTKLYPSVNEVSASVKQLFCSWDTAGLEAGYYILRFWISLNISGAKNTEDLFVEDYRLTSPEMNRYIKADS